MLARTPQPNSFSTELYDLIRGLPVRDVFGPMDVPVRSVVEDSRQVVADSAFLLCPGERSHGRSYVHNALEAGARVLFTETPVTAPHGVTQVRIGNLLSMRHMLPARFYRFPEKELSLVGVIGSRMRTQVSTLAHYMLDRGNEPTGLINSQRYDFGRFIEAPHLATPEPCDLYRLLHSMVANHRHNVVLEISTQGLLRRRVQSLGMHVLAFTDHCFDPQASQEWGNVLPLKLNAFLRGWDRGCPDIAVINRHDNQAGQLLARLPIGVDSITYGIEVGADVRAENLSCSPLGWHFDLCWAGGRVKTVYPVKGKRECVLEALGAIAIAHAFERDLREMAWRLSDWSDDANCRPYLF